MKTFAMFLMLLLAAGMLGCGKQPEPRHIVILPDVSGSIERKSLEQAFKAIDEIVGHLQRGDKIAIIPIVGDAQAQASGQIIRFEVPKERKAYDSDLRDFRRNLTLSLAKLQTNALAQPGSRTDILGAIELAAQEFEAAPGNSDCLVFVLSDFIQEDRQLDFRKDRRLESDANGRRLAGKLLKIHPLNLSGTRVYLGLLRSREYAEMSQERRDSVQTFWITYFQSVGSRPTFVADGPGFLHATLSLNQR